nr:MAG TPA: hypothetical protein [Caudoviricetes sp.]
MQFYARRDGWSRTLGVVCSPNVMFYLRYKLLILHI